MSNSYKKHYAESGKAGKRKKHKRIYNKKIRNLKDDNVVSSSLIKKYTDTIKGDLDYCFGGFYYNTDNEEWYSDVDKFPEVNKLKDKIELLKSEKLKITQENINNVFFQIRDRGYSAMINTNAIIYKHLEKTSPAKNILMFDQKELAKRFHMFITEETLKEGIVKHNAIIQNRIEWLYELIRLRKQAEKVSNKKFEMYKSYLAK